MRISSGHCVLRITKFDEKISLALREKKKEEEKGQTKLSYAMKFLQELLTWNNASL